MPENFVPHGNMAQPRLVTTDTTDSHYKAPRNMHFDGPQQDEGYHVPTPDDRTPSPQPNDPCNIPVAPQYNATPDSPVSMEVQNEMLDQEPVDQVDQEPVTTHKSE